MTSQKFEEMSELEANIPVYVITATYPRLEQIAELTRMNLFKDFLLTKYAVGIFWKDKFD